MFVSKIIKSSPRRYTFYRVFSAALVVVALAGFGCDEEAPEEPTAIPGAKVGSERWVVFFDENAVDLSAYRTAQKEKADTTKIEAQLRADAKERYKDFEAKLAGFDGIIVDYWYLTSAVTVEIPSGARGTLKTLPGVTGIKPDQWLD